MKYVIHPQFKKLLLKLGTILLSTLLMAVSGFLSKVLEPAVAWLSFASFRLLIKLTKSKSLKALYSEMKKGYYGEV